MKFHIKDTHLLTVFQNANFPHTFACAVLCGTLWNSASICANLPKKKICIYVCELTPKVNLGEKLFNLERKLLRGGLVFPPNGRSDPCFGCKGLAVYSYCWDGMW